MEALLHRPAPPLDRWISAMWWTTGEVARPRRELVLPSGAADIVINLGEDVFTSYDGVIPVARSGAIVSGARAAPLEIAMAARTSALGVHFRPGGAAAFMDVGDLGDPVDLAAVLGATSLRERLMALPPSGAFAVMERFLLGRLRPEPGHPLVAEALRAFADPDLPSVAAVCQRTRLAPARLIALFRREVGLTPKTFWRVRRFRTALRRLEAGEDKATLAAAAGYCDQAHFNRDFRTFTGLSPSQYLAAPHDRPNHVPAP